MYFTVQTKKIEILFTNNQNSTLNTINSNDGTRKEY